MKKEIDLTTYKEILKETFYVFNQICIENNIDYSLIGGSLIGCVRNGGIIPWDDDIDVVMTKENIDKLINIINNKENFNFKILTHENTVSYYYPFPKFVNLNTRIIEDNQREIKDYGIFIDIFQYNNLPDNKLKREIYCRKIKVLKQLINGYAQLYGDNIFKRFRNYCAKKLGIDYILKLYKNHTERYNNKNHKYVIGNWPVYSINKEMQLSTSIGKYTTHQFEETDAKIFENYDSILSTTFGDYMTPPPKEKQITHHNMKAFYK